MHRYLISFDDGAMTFPEEDLPDVAEASHKVVRDARNAGVWVFGGGLAPAASATVVEARGADKLITDGPFAEGKEYLGGFSVIEVADLDEALRWGREFVAAIGLPIEVRPFEW